MINSLQHRGSIAMTVVLLLVVFALLPTQAQTFKVMHTFHTGKGPMGPLGPLVLDPEGNLYGVAGGGKQTCWSHSECGTVFKMNQKGKILWFRSFDGANGLFPNGGLLRDEAGNLFGTTVNGGKASRNCVASGCGVVFKLNRPGSKETVLHKFTGNPDGFEPSGSLTEDSGGNLYGATVWGGTDFGIVFKVDQTGKETILYTFNNEADGADPYAGVIRDSTGNVFGTTGYGGDTYCHAGQGCGTVFKLDSAGTETVLYSFTWGSDGAFPSSGLIQDGEGNLYGETQLGGNLGVYDCDGNEGCGVVYKLSPNSNGTWTDTTLYEFCPQSSCAGGWLPQGSLVRDASGNLYGTTYWGGASQCDGLNEGCGVVFKLDIQGNETVLHTFTGGKDGAWPLGGLVMDGSGTLYGTAGWGGDASCHINSDPGCGVVFKITP